MTYLDDVMRLMLAATQGEPEEQRIEVIRAAMDSAYKRVQSEAVFKTDRAFETDARTRHGVTKYRLN